MSYRKRRADEAELDSLPYRPSLAVSTKRYRGDINTRDDYYDYHRYMEEDRGEIIRESRWYRENNRYDRGHKYSRPVKHHVGRNASPSRARAQPTRTCERSYKRSPVYDTYDRYERNDRYRSNDSYGPRLTGRSSCGFRDHHRDSSEREYRYQYSSKHEREERKSPRCVDQYAPHRTRYSTSRDPVPSASRFDNKTDNEISRATRNDISLERCDKYGEGQNNSSGSIRSRVDIDDCLVHHNNDEPVANGELVASEQVFDDTVSSSSETDQKTTDDFEKEYETNKPRVDDDSDETEQNDDINEAEKVDTLNRSSETDQQTTDDCEDDCVLEVFIDGFWDAFDNDEEDFKLLVEQREKEKNKSLKKIR